MTCAKESGIRLFNDVSRDFNRRLSVTESNDIFPAKVKNPQFQEVYDVLPKDVLDNKELVYLIDVRRPDEFNGELGHIKGSKLLTLDFLPQKINELKTDKPIVFICRSGNRSAHAASFALQNGIKNIYNMSGGMILWNELGFEKEY